MKPDCSIMSLVWFNITILSWRNSVQITLAISNYYISCPFPFTIADLQTSKPVIMTANCHLQAGKYCGVNCIFYSRGAKLLIHICCQLQMIYKHHLTLYKFSQMMVVVWGWFPNNLASQCKLSVGIHQGIPYDNLSQLCPSRCLCALEDMVFFQMKKVPIAILHSSRHLIGLKIAKNNQHWS